MKRLIALPIAILTLLFGGVQPAVEPKDAPAAENTEVKTKAIEPVHEIVQTEPEAEQNDITTKSVTELSTEKEMPGVSETK